MNLVTLENVLLQWGPHPLLDHVQLQIEAGERVCLLGRNGEGKSTLLKLLTDELKPDDGVVRVREGVRIGRLPQNLPADDTRNAYTVVASAFPETGELLARFEALSHSLDAGDPEQMRQLARIQERIETLEGWSLDQRIRQTLERYDIDPEVRLCDLSGGWQRRVLLAQAMVAQPDLLLLDEPTNHLDVPAIAWLEKELLGFGGAVLFVSHDRAFIRAMATRIVELDRGVLKSWPGNYERYLELKEKALEEEERHNAEFDKKLAQEEAWIRQGIKARRTRNMGRVRALQALREERKQRRERTGRAAFGVEDARKSGKLVVEAVNAEFGFDPAKPIIRDLNLTLIRGDKIGLIGENGTGKTTLVRLLLGDLQPTSGTIRLGTQRDVAYFDQLRAELDPEKTALDNLSEGREFIEVNGHRKHVLGYLGDFLFTPERARTPTRVLSGGERARLLLAKLFSNPANILVLDEPTNDLDVETLELLEEQLVAFSGTVILISHDREFLDNVVTSTLFLDGTGVVREYVGGYVDWRRQGGRFPREEVRESRAESSLPAAKPAVQSVERKAAPKAGKLSYKLKLELESLPADIEALETEMERRRAEVNDPDFYQQDHETINQRLAELTSLEQRHEILMARWMELEEMS